MTNITRRAALLAIPAAAALPAVAAGSQSAEIASLIASHAREVARSRSLWETCSDIADAINDKLPRCRVQTSRLLKGRDDEGNSIYEPMYSTHPGAIDKIAASNITTFVGVRAHGPRAAEIEQEIREHWTAWADRKKAELSAVIDERWRIEEEAGLTAAEEAADQSSEIVRGIEEQILDLVPETLEVARRKASWVVEAYSGDNHSFAYQNEESLLAALQTIAKMASA